jgi:hypothetical protein
LSVLRRHRAGNGTLPKLQRRAIARRCGKCLDLL